MGTGATALCYADIKASLWPKKRPFSLFKPCASVELTLNVCVNVHLI